MKTSRETIEQKVKSYLKDNFHDKVKTEKIKSFMIEKGYSQGEVTRMINLNQYPEMWNETDLGSMALAINSIEGLDIKNYYNESEINNLINFKNISKKTNEDVMIFENAFRTTENQFMIPVVSIHQLNEYFDAHLIGYNPEIQRELLRSTNKKGEIIEKINLNKKKMNEIANKVVTGKFFSNAINLNVLKTGQENVKYNEDSKRLIIEVDENTTVNIIDGFHRLSGFLKSIQIDPNIDFNTSINISILDKSMASEFIYQEDLHTSLSKSKAKLLNTADPFMEISKKLNKLGNESTNELFNRLAEDYNELKLNKNKFCTFETFSEAIKFNFFDNDNKVSARKVDNVTEFLQKGFNEIIGILKDKFETIENIKNNGYYLENNMFIGYMALLSKLQNNENWKQILEQSINNIDFNKDNNEWKQLEILSNKINKSIIKKISGYFEGSVL